MRALWLISFLIFFTKCGDTDQPIVAEPVCELTYFGEFDHTLHHGSEFVITSLNDSLYIENFSEYYICNPQDVMSGSFQLRGEEYIDCEDLFCVKITELLDPWCEPELPLFDVETDIYNFWRLTRIFDGDSVLLPSCQGSEFVFSPFGFSSELPNQISGDFGRNSIAGGFHLIDENKISFGQDFHRTELAAPPHISLLENVFPEYFFTGDTLNYLIENSQIHFTDPDQQLGFSMYLAY